MLNIEITQTGSLDNSLARIQSDFPLSKISRQVQDDIKEEAQRRGWNRIPDTVKRRVIDRNTHEIYLGGKSKDIAAYLQRGTIAHFIRPVRKSALHWIQGGVSMFSKGHFVRGIKATNFFRVYESTINRIGGIIKSFLKTA